MQSSARSVSEAESTTLRVHAASGRRATAVAGAKILLAGEHAVVFGRHALALPIPAAARAFVRERTDTRQTLCIPAWGIPEVTPLTRTAPLLQNFLRPAIAALRLTHTGWHMHLDMQVPRSSGLGGSAALAVVAIRALANAFALPMTDEDINGLAFACEKVAHVNPSGVDNTLAVHGRPLLFRRTPQVLQPLVPARPGMRLIIGWTGEPSMTSSMVQRVQASHDAAPGRVGALFDAIDACTLRAKDALEAGDRRALGQVMDDNHACLTQLGVSSPALAALVALARRHGALGAKLTGGGGAMLALVHDDDPRVPQAFGAAGYESREIII